MSRLLACAAAILALSQAAPTLKPTAGMRADVDRLVARAAELTRLWPWMAAYPEIDRVVRHGKAVAPLLVALLAVDPDEPEPEMADWRVQQNAALALCRIYKVSEECGHVYCNRTSREVNKGVRRFWVDKTSEQTNPQPDKRPPQAAGQSETGTTPPTAQTQCVSFETRSRVLAGDSFTTPIGKRLEFRLRSEPAGSWDIIVGPAGTPLDYLWVASPPFRTAPHRQIGRGYNLTATESAQLSRRRFRFVTTAQEYEEAQALFDRASREGLGVTAQDFEKRGKGTLELWITGYGLTDAADALTWITVRGNACQPR
jgi:hypothetical protein